MKAFNLVLRFILELCGLVAASYWGFTKGPDGFELLFGVAAPLVVGLAWGSLVAPKARFRLPYIWKLVLGVIILGICGMALMHAGRPALGVAYIVIVVLNAAATHAWGQPLDGVTHGSEQPSR